MNEKTTGPDQKQKTDISIIRKIVIWTFIIGFWLFYYWYLDKPEQTPSSSTPMESENHSPDTPSAP